MYLLHVHAGQTVAQRARQRRESTREKTSHQARLRRRRRLRCLLVPYTGKGASLEGIILFFSFDTRYLRCRSQRYVAGNIGDQISGGISAYHSNDNDTDRQPHPRLYQ